MAPVETLREAPDLDRGFSVLMSIYHGEEPGHFRESIKSIFQQTLMPPEVVLVCDGPLTDALDTIIEEYQELYPDLLKVVRLPQNGGLGKALNEGLRHCRYELIARMDADDIAYPIVSSDKSTTYISTLKLICSTARLMSFEILPTRYYQDAPFPRHMRPWYVMPNVVVP